MKNELIAMLLDMIAFALENGIATLPTGETPVELLGRISESLRDTEGTPVVRRGRRKKDKDAEPEAAG